MVRAQVADPNGRNWKVRPLIIIDNGITWGADDLVELVCVTTSFDPKDQRFVQLPFEARRGGHPATRLTMASAAACHWLKRLCAHDIDTVAGYVPESYMEAILSRVRALNKETVSLSPKKLAEKLRRDQQE